MGINIIMNPGNAEKSVHLNVTSLQGNIICCWCEIVPGVPYLTAKRTTIEQMNGEISNCTQGCCVAASNWLVINV